MIRLRVFLALTLALLLGSGAWLPARGTTADWPVPAGLTPAAWQAIQSQVAKLTAADGSTSFGVSVSLDGDTAVVGAMYATVGGNYDQGAGFIFYRHQGGPDMWGQVAKLTAADGGAGDYFGMSVSVSGDTAVVAAGRADVGGNESQGAAYVFYRNQGGPDAWGQVAKLTAADGAAYDHFDCVSVSSDTAVVGAMWADVGDNIDQGAAYVFYRNQGGLDAWGQVAKLTADGATGELRFGASVAVNGDTALVGAYWDPAAYVFYRNQSGADAWGQVAKLTPADGWVERFGWSVSVSGDTAVVGADGADVGDNPNQGAAYVFYRDQGGLDAWGQVAKLTADDGGDGDHFGYSVSVSGDTAVVGANKADIGGNYYQGAAYVFYRRLGGSDAWGQVAKLTAADGARGDWFGISVSVSGDTAIVGAYAAGPAGAAYVYALPPVAEDDEYSTLEDTPLEISAVLGVLANDIDPGGDPFSAVLDVGPLYGTLDLHADGSFVYTPTTNFFGLDSFLYHASDGEENSDMATVAITVTAVNDAPMALDDAYRTLTDWSLTVAGPGVLLNDTDAENDPLTAVPDSGPSHGTLDLNTDGSFTYSPTAGFSGVDTFIYHANDGVADSNIATVQITVITYRIWLPVVLRDG
jgi:VCBS repeat-containing protein